MSLFPRKLDSSSCITLRHMITYYLRLIDCCCFIFYMYVFVVLVSHRVSNIESTNQYCLVTAMLYISVFGGPRLYAMQLLSLTSKHNG